MLSKNFLAVSRSHVLRDGNWFAHHLDRLIPFGVEQRWENHCPPEVSSYVLMDSLVNLCTGFPLRKKRYSIINPHFYPHVITHLIN